MIRAGALAALCLSAPPVWAAETYRLDPSHSQALFSYDHLGYSTTWGLFSGFEGTIRFDRDDPAASSVDVSIPVEALFTGWEARDATFLTEDFFGTGVGARITFVSTGIEVTGDATAVITGDLTVAGVTVPVALDTRLTRDEPHPVEGRDWLGLTAATVLKRSEFGMGDFVPFISDEVEVRISIEAGAAD